MRIISARKSPEDSVGRSSIANELLVAVPVAGRLEVIAPSSTPGIALVRRSSSRLNGICCANVRYGSSCGLFGAESQIFAVTTCEALNPGFCRSKSRRVSRRSPAPIISTTANASCATMNASRRRPAFAL